MTSQSQIAFKSRYVNGAVVSDIHVFEVSVSVQPTCTDLSVQVRIFFQKYGFLDFCTDFFFKTIFIGFTH